MAKMFEGAIKNWKSVLIFLLFSVIFWLAQFAWQYFDPANAGFPIEVYKIALVRSFAFTGTTFIAAALLSSVIFKFRPKFAVHWPTRRNFGVVGTFFVIAHIFAATGLYFAFNLSQVYFSLDPFVNPIIFGALALPIFIIVSIVSTDWVQQKLGANWKTVQRLVYIAFMFAIFHFTKQNPAALAGPPWLLLAAVTILAIVGELYWFIKITIDRKKITAGTLIGAAIILLYLATGYFSFFAK